MPIHMPQCAGKPYRPSNGTEGDMFQERFCCRCTKDSEEKACRILMLTMIHEKTDADYPKEWVFDVNGCPTCTAFEARK